MKIGLEIHQRLKSTKLFCNCSSEIPESEAPHHTIKRKLHPVLSELGEMDAAAISETHKDREFTYQIFSNNCLVETDEEPPRKMNMDALHIVLDIAHHLNATVLDEIHIMRKLVIDGSNTSGFQRTAIIAVNGFVESTKGKVNIPLIALEEDSAGIVSNDGNSATYRLDRLGIPLIEISTSPDIKDAQHLEEVAEKIGLILRASGKVARGLGTIRQDVNVSTEGGARVEIKGAQDLKMIGEIANGEAKRQLELLKILTILREKKSIPIEYSPIDLTHLFKKSLGDSDNLNITNGPISMIQKGVQDGSVIIAHKLKNHKGLLGIEIQKGKRYGTEVSDYAKRSGVKGIIHSDEALEKYGINETDQERIKKELNLSTDDAFFMVIAKKEQALLAIRLGLDRINFDSVPGETRKANPDGTTNFMRPIAGRARLYPETDVPPLRITEELLSLVHKSDSLEDKKEKLKKLLNVEMADKILKSRNLPLFEKLSNRYKDKSLDRYLVDPTLIATTLENTLISLRREGFEFSDFEKTLTDLFDEYAQGAFVKAAIPDILKGMAKGARAESVIKVYRFGKISGAALEKIVSECNYDLRQIMLKYRLQVDPAEVSELLKKKT